MARITRKTQKIFAGNSNQNQITTFGTAKNISPTYSNDVGLIQTDTYTKGWSDSLVSDLAPFLQDSNALHYVETKQLAYLFQEGIAEYDSNTEYSKGSLVKVTSDIYCNIYKSIKDVNIGHATNDTTYWTLYLSDTNMANYQIAEVRMTLNDNLLANEIWLEGQAVNRITYASLFNIFGVKYGSGDGVNTFNLPNFTNRTVWGSTSATGYVSAGLPNITGVIGFSGIDPKTNKGSASGAFVKSNSSGAGNSHDYPAGSGYVKFDFNASRSSSIYGASGTVQPPAVKVRFKTRWY